MNTNTRQSIIETLAKRINEAEKDPFNSGLEIVENYFYNYVKSWYFDYASFQILHTNNHCQWRFYVDFLGTTYTRLTNDEDHYLTYKEDCETIGPKEAQKIRLEMLWDYWQEQALEELTHEISNYIN